ncbi:MAG: beta-N-acetylglucosaminidase domain-containing protein [Chlamydiales bacterium]
MSASSSFDPSRNSLNSSTGDSFGVVEGFYWEKENEYKGQFGDYTHEQRCALISLMKKKGLNVYVYDPKRAMDSTKPQAIKARPIRATKLLDDYSRAEWKTTFEHAKKMKVEFIWGLTPSSDLTEEKYQALKSVIQQVTELGATGIAFLFDDKIKLGERIEEKEDRIIERVELEAPIVQKFYEDFPTLIKAYCPPCYRGKPNLLRRYLDFADRIINKSIPFVLTGLHTWSRSLAHEDFPTFEGRKIVVWDNWIASDKLRLENFNPLPPPDRDRRLLSNISGYWLNLAFPFERVIPVVSSLEFLITHKRSPNLEETYTLLLGPGGLAEQWATEMGVTSDFTRAVFNIKFSYFHAAINPNVDDIIDTSDLHSIELLLSVGGLSIDTPVKPNKTLLQLAVEKNNYPLATFLKAKGAKFDDAEWENFKVGCKFICNREINSQLSSSERMRLKIVKSIDQYDLVSLQKLLKIGISATTINNNQKTLATIAAWHGWTPLAKFLKALAHSEKS